MSRPRVLILVTDFKPPWDEGGKNNIRALRPALESRFDLAFAGLSNRTILEEMEGAPSLRVRTPFFDTVMGRLAYPVGCLRLLGEIPRLIEDFRPDLILSYLETASASLLAAWLRQRVDPRTPVVHVVWNDIYALERAPLRSWFTEHLPNLLMNNRLLARLGLSRMDGIAASSQYLVERVRDLGFPSVGFAPTGVDPDRFRPVRPLEPRPPFVLGYLGHLSYTKGVTDMLEATRPLLEDGTVRLRMSVTEGEEAAALERAAHPALSVEGRTDPTRFFNDCDLVLVPRRSSYGAVSYPNTLLEAMACGRPVITTDLPGIDELVDHGVEGYRARPADPASLRHHILEALARPDDLVRMGTAARERILARHSWDRVGDRLVGILHGVLGSSTGAGDGSEPGWV